MKTESMDAVFLALANSSRRRILDIVKAMPGCSVNDVCKYFDMSRIGVMKHLRVLEEVELLTSQKVGRTRELYFNAVPIQLIYDRWTTEYAALWASHAVDLKVRAEATASQKEGERKKVR